MLIAVPHGAKMKLKRQKQVKNDQLDGKSESRSPIKRKTYSLRQLAEVKYKDESSSEHDSSSLVSDDITKATNQIKFEERNQVITQEKRRVSDKSEQSDYSLLVSSHILILLSLF